MMDTPLRFKIIRPWFLMALFFIILSSFSSANATSVTLRWDAVSPTPDRYRIYVREAGNAYNYNSYAWSGSTVTCTINNLDSRTDYYFVVRAYDNGLESTNSNEVHLDASLTSSSSTDTTAPWWSGATTGVGSVTDNGTGGSVTVEFDTAKDAVDGSDLKYNVYYAAGSSLDWNSSNVVADATVKSGGTFANAVTISGLNNVKYTFGVRVEDQSGNEDANTTKMTVTPTVLQTSGSYNLMLSTNSNRSGAVYLDDAELEGKMYVFVTPTTSVKKVEFFIDGTLKQTESYAPYDLAGGSSTQANPFNADQLSSGYHTFSARVTKTDGSRVTISAEAHLYDSASGSSPSDSVTGGDSEFTQWVSTSANRSNPKELDGATLSGYIYVFATPTTNVKKIEFYIDGSLKQTENYAPFDLAGAASGGLAAPYNSRQLSDGYHTFKAIVTRTNGTSETISARGYVNN